ncbi:PepSY domain-containing protein [uncultured Lacticaseibacillus sp.]|uniref:PepSY domain-containing protein n=1 Tax=uncultured Lacticaseibacillus sp. TaxID=2775882 RepID=UPI002596AA72|nr:PepSY domain-containing protein [uncultured Lacticaseibacillus sp.]
MRLAALAVLSLLVLAGCGQQSASHHDGSASSVSSTSSVSATPSREVKVSLSAVVELMHNRWGDDVDLTSIEIEPVGSRYQYEVEAVNDDTEYQMVLNGRTGKVVRHSEQPLDADEAGGAERREKGIATDKLRALGHVTAAATKAVPGTATEWSLEKDDGVPVWSVKVRSKQGTMHEVDVQADNVAVLSSEDDD